MRKKIVLFLIIIFILISTPALVFSQDNNDVFDVLNSQYDQFDFSSIDGIMRDFAQLDFSDIVKSILNGTFDSEKMIWQNITNFVLPTVRQFASGIPIILILIIIVGVIDGISVKNTDFVDHVHTVANALISITIITSFAAMFSQTTKVFSTMTAVLETLVPILTIALVASGASSTAAMLNPDSAVLSQTVNSLVAKIVLPIILLIAVLVVLDTVFIHNRFGGLVAWGKSSANWITGFIFTVFSAIISIKGFVASSYDGISLRTIRYAMNNSVPLVGSLIGDGINMALACSSIVKSAIGVASFILIILVVASPLVSLIIYMLILKAVSAVTLPFMSSQTAGLISSFADLTKCLISLIIGMSIILFIIIGFTSGAANII